MTTPQKIRYSIKDEQHATEVAGLYTHSVVSYPKSKETELFVRVQGSCLEDKVQGTLSTRVQSAKINIRDAERYDDTALLHISYIPETFSDAYLLGPSYASKIAESLSPMMGRNVQFSFHNGALKNIRLMNESTGEYTTYDPESTEAKLVAEQVFNKDITQYRLDSDILLTNVKTGCEFKADLDLVNEFTECLREPGSVVIVRQLSDIHRLAQQIEVLEEEEPLLLTEIVEDDLPVITGIPVSPFHVRGVRTSEFVEKHGDDDIIYLNPDQTQALFQKTGVR